jgi:hypothetical protein
LHPGGCEGKFCVINLMIEFGGKVFSTTNFILNTGFCRIVRLFFSASIVD